MKKPYVDGMCIYVECEACFARAEAENGFYCDALHDTEGLGENCPFFKFRDVRGRELAEIEERAKARASHGG